MPNAETIKHLAIAINSVESSAMQFPKHRDESEKIRATLYKFLMDTAYALFLGGVPLAKLNKAIQSAGWDDQEFVECTPPYTVNCLMILHLGEPAE